MGVLMELGILSLVGLLIYGVLRVLARAWGVAAKKHDQKLSEETEHKRVDIYVNGKPLEGVTNLKIELDKLIEIDKRRPYGKDYSATQVILGEEYPYWKESITNNHYSPDEVETIEYQSHFDGAGHGGSFGGGGASGSWSSDDSSSSSYSDGGSSDSGGSDSSSSD